MFAAVIMRKGAGKVDDLELKISVGRNDQLYSLVRDSGVIDEFPWASQMLEPRSLWACPDNWSPSTKLVWIGLM